MGRVNRLKKDLRNAAKLFLSSSGGLCAQPLNDLGIRERKTWREWDAWFESGDPRPTRRHHHQPSAQRAALAKSLGGKAVQAQRSKTMLQKRNAREISFGQGVIRVPCWRA
jgi:hypothetical protein